ncbi:hypothetical protein C4588_08050 [Candidatus Parcubacteria bacterium]|nr:MAG: hypothetical protein C4588_08050 [Candidatus Parcubacteria bacterium]
MDNVGASQRLAVSSWKYSQGSPESKLKLQTCQEYIVCVNKELDDIHHRYHLFGKGPVASLTNCEVLAIKLFLSKIPKTRGVPQCEFGISKLINGKRNVFIYIDLAENNGGVQNYILDICAVQYGNYPTLQLANSQNLAEYWQCDVRYKSFRSLLKRLSKEGRSKKELHLKDAIAHSNCYELAPAQSNLPTHLDLHLINPEDSAGKKFLNKFPKEIGFKTNLAQMLLDSDSQIVDAARIIANILLKR